MLDRWPLPADLDEAGLEARVFPTRPTVPAQARPAPDWAAIHDELRSQKYVTLQLVWQEYKQSNPDGYQYSRFCEFYGRWGEKLDLVLRQEHRAGEKLFVDLDAECQSDLLRNSLAAPRTVAPFHFDNSVDQVSRRSFGTGPTDSFG